jgi:hypothetical protein
MFYLKTLWQVIAAVKAALMSPNLECDQIAGMELGSTETRLHTDCRLEMAVRSTP